MSANRSSNVFWIVAVSTRVPDTNATPRITAIAVNRKRILLAARPLRVTFHIAGPRILHAARCATTLPEVPDAAARTRPDSCSTHHGRSADNCCMLFQSLGRLASHVGVRMDRATSKTRSDVSPTGSCWCGCGAATAPTRFFVAGHDRRAESAVIEIEFGGIPQFLAAHGYGSDGKHVTTELERHRDTNGS